MNLSTGKGVRVSMCAPYLEPSMRSSCEKFSVGNSGDDNEAGDDDIEMVSRGVHSLKPMMHIAYFPLFPQNL